MTQERPTHHWQVTVRSVGESTQLQAVIAETILPLVLETGRATHVALAGCINCAGELTFMADWSSVEDVSALEASEPYRAALEAIEPDLRVPPKRELWRLLA